MGKQIMYKTENSDDSDRYENSDDSDRYEKYRHIDGSWTEIIDTSFGKTYTHHDSETGITYTEGTDLGYGIEFTHRDSKTGKVYKKTILDGSVYKDLPLTIVRILWIIPLAMVVIGIFAVRNSAYTMLATPFIVYRLALGEGLGWIALALCVVPSILFAVIANRTEKAGVILSFVWAFLLGLGMALYHRYALKDPLYMMDVAGDNWIDVISLFIGSVIHVFMFMLIIQSLTILFSFTWQHISLFWAITPIVFIVLNIISVVFNYFGSSYPTDPERYYEMIRPICHGLGLSQESMYGAMNWLSGFTYDLPLYCFILLILIVIVFFIRAWRK